MQMMDWAITGRSVGGPEEYRPLAELGVEARVLCLGGTGAAEDPRQLALRVTNPGPGVWQGVVRLELQAAAGEARYYLPGFMYGTNRGDAPLVVDSKCPRLRLENEFPASPWWMVRSDRLSHPVALAFDGAWIRGLAGSPYLVQRDGQRHAWQPGENGTPDQFAGFGCSLKDGRVYYTLGYENAPHMFLDAHQFFPRAELGQNCLTLQPGEAITVRLDCFDYPAQDERGIHAALRHVYGRYHQPPRRRCSVRETVETIAGAIARDAWLPHQHSYSGFVFDRPEGFEYRALPSISWTNGLSAATPMLLCALRLGDEQMRAQALDCIEHIVRCSINPRSGLPYMVEKDGVWSNRGWWADRLPASGHAAYLVGQSVYLILKAYAWEKRERGVEHAAWLDFARRVVERTERSRNQDGEYPYILSEKTGAGLVYDSFSGAWCMAAAAYLAFLTGERQHLPALLASERWYHDAYVRHQECYGGPLDIDKNIDSEGVLAYIRAVRYLHEMSGDDVLLDHLQDALEYEFTFKFCYNTPNRVPPLSAVGWSSCGGSITSVTNPHIHPMSSSVMDEMHYFLARREDGYIRSRLQDTLWWSCQCHNTFDGEFGYGRRGWMSERFCHSEGLVKEHYPDGTPASTWFALMPWACGSILEGLAGDMWREA